MSARFNFYFFSALCAAIVLAALAGDLARAQSDGAGSDGETLGSTAPDELFQALKDAGSGEEAQAIADQIWRIWFTGPTDEANEIMDAALARRRVYDFAGAHEILDGLVDAYPDWTEAWNQRAFVRFLQERYDESLEDVAEVLEREPRHFGALGGKAIIFLRQGRIELGQRALRETLAVHPWSPERAMLIQQPGQPI